MKKTVLAVLLMSLGGCATNGDTLMGSPVHWGVFEKDMNRVIDLTDGYTGEPAYIRVNYETNVRNPSQMSQAVQTNFTRIGNIDLMQKGLVETDYFENDKDNIAATVKPGKTILYARCRRYLGQGATRIGPWGEPQPITEELIAGNLYTVNTDEIYSDGCHPVIDTRKFNYTPPTNPPAK
ncbi:MAG: hypothetical protein PHE17_16425 [Thiothrix sp.]|uniref:hypothetical protein n=1 Tax=Thiothrix sp. TaxID=1032 RepID=UPI002601B25F|nr:hypothetical protein [Thiothrix sp.]MDD5394602.1 hypothetical protein [Thiothrix sp.]